MPTNYLVDGPASDEELGDLFADAWPNYEPLDFQPLIAESLFHVLAKRDDVLVGFIRVTSCGTTHGMVFGPTVRSNAQRQGVGLGLLNEVAAAAKERGVTTLHVEFAGGLRRFYSRAGFRHTAGGVLRL